MDELKISPKILCTPLQNNLTPSKVTQKTGFAKSYLSKVESGWRSPPIATLSKIAQALGVGYCSFFLTEKDLKIIIVYGHVFTKAGFVDFEYVF